MSLAILGLSCFQTNFKIFCSSSVKSVLGNWIGIAWNLLIALGSIVILTILIILLQEHGIFFHLFVSSLISFISVLWFSEHRSFYSLGRFIPKYFILFDAMVNEIVSLISLSDLSLLVYRSAVDFCALILYPASFPDSWMNSNSFLIISLGFS